MKKSILSFAAFIAILIGSRSLAQAQAVHQGNFTIDAYYGFPNLTTGILKAAVRTTYGSLDLSAKGLGPVGGRAMYMVTDEIAVGVDVFYARTEVDFTTTYNDSLLGTQTFAAHVDNPRPRFLLRAEYHFGGLEKADFYGAAGLGVNASRVKITTQDPFFDQNLLNLRPIIPVAYRLAVGARFYPIPFLGINAELGIGGPLMTVGLTGKF